MTSRKYPTVLFAGALAACLIAPGIPAQAAGPDELLKLVPSDAWGFLATKSLKNLDDKAAALKDALGLAYETPVTPMALGMLGIADEIDNSSPIGVVMLDAQKYGDAQKATILLIPTKDPKALLKKLAPEEADTGATEKKNGDGDEPGDSGSAGEPQEGISKCSVMGEPGFAAVRGKIVILGPGEEAVAKIAKSKKTMGESFGEARLAALRESDLYISVAMGRVAGAYKPMVLPLMQMATAAQGMSGKDIEMLFKLFEEMDALDIGITFDQKGFGLQFLSIPQKGSDLAKLYEEQHNSKAPLLNILPAQKYLLAFGATASNSEIKKKFGGDASISNLMKMLQLGELNEEALKTLDQTLIKMQDSISRYAMSLSFLGAEADGLFGVCLVAETASAKDFTESVRKMYKTVGKVTDDEEFADALKHVKHQTDAETIAGSKVDTLTVDIDAVAKKLESDESVVKHFRALLGKECVIRFGAADDKHFVVSFGGGTKQFQTACGAVKSSGDLLSTESGIESAGKDLPSPRTGEAFLAVDTAAQAIRAVGKAIGEEDEFPFDLPTLNAPVAFGTCMQAEISRTNMVIPMKLIKAGKEAYDKYAAKASKDDFDDDEAGESKGKGGKGKPKDKAPDGDEEKPADEDSGKSDE